MSEEKTASKSSLTDEQQQKQQKQAASLNKSSSEERQFTRKIVQEVIIKIEMNKFVDSESSTRVRILDRDKSRSEGSLLDVNQSHEKVERSLSDSGVRETDNIQTLNIDNTAAIESNDKIKKIDTEISTKLLKIPMMAEHASSKSEIETVSASKKINELDVKVTKENDATIFEIEKLEEVDKINNDVKSIEKPKVKPKSCLPFAKPRENVESLYESDQNPSTKREYKFEKPLPSCACKCIMIKDREYHDLYCPSDRKPAAKSISSKSSVSSYYMQNKEKTQKQERTGELMYDENGLVKINWKKVLKHLRSSCPSKKLKLLQAIRWVSS